MTDDELRAALTAYLSEFFGTTVKIRNLEPSTAGARRSSVLFEAVMSGEARALVATVMLRPDLLLQPFEVEPAILEIAAGEGIRVAPLVALCTDGSVLGGPFFVTERVAGETVPRRVLELVERRDLAEAVVAELAASMGRLHRVDAVTAPPGIRVSGCEATLDDAEHRWSRLPERSSVLRLALNWLRSELPGEPPRWSLLHGDLRVGNVIVDDTGLAAIIDWEGARLGDPMDDLAWGAVRMWRFGRDERECFGMTGRGLLVDGYRRAGGTWDAGRYHWWKIMHSVSWGIMLAEQARDFTEGRSTSLVGAASGRRVAEQEFDVLVLLGAEQ